jgi:hypothetical protein
MLSAWVGALVPGAVAAHGLVGKRFFPATLTTEDPFVADELSLPTLSGRKMPASGDEPPARETAFSADVTKRVTDNFGIGFGASYVKVQPEGAATERGFDDLELGLKYQFYQDAERESILSVGVDWDIGGSGSKRVGAEPFSTITPALFFGKGFGDLPQEARYLRPLALTGQLGVGFPTRSRTTTDSDGEVAVERNPHVLQWGFALEYSFPYLQSYVQDVGLGAPFKPAHSRRGGGNVDGARPRRERNDGHDQSGNHLGRHVFPARGRSADSGQQGQRPAHGMDRAASFLPRRPVSEFTRASHFPAMK